MIETYNEAIASVTFLKLQLNSTISKSERLVTTLLEVTADMVTNTDLLKSSLKGSEEIDS